MRFIHRFIRPPLAVVALLGSSWAVAASQAGIGLGADNQPYASATTFEAYVNDAKGAKGNRTHLSTTDVVSVGANIVPDSADIGSDAEILTMAIYQTPQKANLMFTRQGEAGWVMWDGNPANLAVANVQTLGKNMAFDVVNNAPFTGMEGDFTIYVGYRLADGRLVYNGNEPIQFSVRAEQTTPNQPDVTLPTTPNNLLAALNFQPDPHGFGFPNYGNDAQSASDLNADDLIALFGQKNVCREPKGACILNAAARTWMEEQIKGMNGGHCEGMAVTSLRFNRNMSFKGKTKPVDFQGNANQVIELGKEAVRNYIAYYFVTQGLQPTATETQNIRLNNRPSGILDLLINAMQSGDTYNMYTLGIYENAQLKGGHAITPFAVEDKGNGEFWVHVYDNNYPKETRYVKIDRAKETWVYEGAATKPGEEASSYRGDASTQSLDLTAMKLRDLQFGCPFCNADVSQRNGNTRQYVEFQLTGEGRVLIRDSQGKATGYDFVTGKYVDEIAGSEEVAVRGGLGKDLPPIYRLPAENAPFEIEVGGVDDQEANLDLTAAGAGYSVGFEGILLDPQERLRMTMNGNGTVLRFTASQDAETPDIFLSRDPVNDTDPSYIFSVDGFELEAGKTITVTLNPTEGTLYFQDNDGNEDEYDLQITQITDQGEQQRDFKDLKVNQGSNARLQFSKWDGLSWQEDDEGNGFDDDAASDLNP